MKFLISIFCISNQASFEWTHNGKATADQEDNYEISNFQLTHEGIYKCLVANSHGSVEKSFNVSVSQPPQIDESNKKFQNVTLKMEEKHHTDCHASGQPEPKIFWKLPNKKMSDSTKLNLSVSSDPGFYTCVAQSDSGKAQSSFYLNIETKPVFLPGFDKNKFKKESKIGEDIELNCPFEHFSQLFWKHNGTVLNKKTSNQFKIRNVNYHKTGEYQCTAVNSIGNSSFAFQVRILEKPWIESRVGCTKNYDLICTEKVVIREGESLNLTCIAHGYPPPELDWKIPENATSEAKEAINTDKFFYLKQIKFADSGSYFCDAEYDNETAIIAYEVMVTYPPKIMDGTKEVFIEEFSGKSLTLICKIIGSPAPTFRWYHEL